MSALLFKQKGARSCEISSTFSTPRAFTLLELLLVIVVIAILMSLLLPVIGKGRQRARQAACMSNLKQIGFAFYGYKQEHEDRIPSGVPFIEGGVREYFFAPGPVLVPDWETYVFRIFLTMTNHLVTPRILVCPADKSTKPADAFGELDYCPSKQHSNVSYAALVAFGGVGEGSKVLWAGDSVGDTNAWNEYLPTFAGQQEGERLGVIYLWSNHGYTRGNWLFGDGHVQSFGSEARGSHFGGSRDPIVTASTSSSGGSPSGPGVLSNNSHNSGSNGAGTSISPSQGQGGTATGSSGQSSSGPPGSGASPGSGTSPGSARGPVSGTFQQLEAFFEGRPVQGQRPSAKGSTRPAESPAIRPPPPTNAPALPTVKSNLSIPLLTNLPGPARIETTPPDLWLAQPGETSTGNEYRTTYGLLLLLLLIIMAMAIQRWRRQRAHKRKVDQSGT